MSIVERILEIFNSYAFVAQGWNPQEEGDYQDFVDAVGSALAPSEQCVRVYSGLAALAAAQPAQTVVTDAVVQRAEQAFWPAYSECTHVHGARKNAHATGMRAALLAVWPT